MTSLHLNNITWSPLGHGHCHHQFQLRAASLHVAAGEFVGLIGPNGSGKTSLLEAIRRELQADSGDVTLPPAWVQSFCTATNAPLTLNTAASVPFTSTVRQAPAAISGA